jgi:colanic acid biosynthesis glycosyl transferase WcaI
MITSGRVILVNRFFWPDHSATAQLLTDLAISLAASGTSVAVVTSRLQYDDPQARLPAWERVNGVDVHRIATTGFGRERLAGRAVDFASFYVTAFAKLITLARRGDVIVAKTDPPLLSLLGHAAAAATGARLVNWLQDVYPEVAGVLGVKAAHGPLGKALAAWRNVSLRAARCNVVLGERMADRLAEARIATDKIRVIPNWSDEQAVEPVPHDANDLRSRWGLTGKFVVGYSGNLGRAHEYETMFAAAQALSDDPRIAFLMIGGGHHTTVLKERAEAAGLTNFVFQPYQPREALAASLSAADLHWVSLKPELEGLIVPSKVYGILAAGRPILAVCARDGEIARLVAQHGCGVHSEPGDPTAFAAHVRTLAGSPERARALGEAARRASTNVFSRAQALSRWSDVLGEAQLNPA